MGGCKEDPGMGLLEDSSRSSTLPTIYELLSFDFAKFGSGENVGISKTEAKPTKLTPASY